MTRRRLVSGDEATVRTVQHRRPCGDCPWRRDALPGWTGDQTPQDWLADAHGESVADCHVYQGPQRAGMAIYRANVCKTPRNQAALRLPGDTERVFSRPAEFLAHHLKQSVDVAR